MMKDENIKEDILILKEATTYSDAELAKKIAKEFNLGYIVKDCEVFNLLGQLYRYGKIQGIREERSKRKKETR